MSTDDKRVREFAYQIWESEGKPEGQEARHWEMARKLAVAEALTPTKSSRTSTTKAAPKANAKAKPAAAAPVAAPQGEKKAAVKKPRAPRKPPAS